MNAKSNGHRKYTDREKGAALAWLDVCGGDVSKAARQLEIPRKTLEDWSKCKKINGDVAELRQEEKKDLKAKLDEVMYKLIDIPDGEIAKASVQQRFTSFGIAFDKNQLIQGKPTAITGQSENRAWAESRLEDIMKRHNIDRTVAIELAKEHAPTIAKWLM